MSWYWLDSYILFYNHIPKNSTSELQHTSKWSVAHLSKSCLVKKDKNDINTGLSNKTTSLLSHKSKIIRSTHMFFFHLKDIMKIWGRPIIDYITAQLFHYILNIILKYCIKRNVPMRCFFFNSFTICLVFVYSRAF